MAWGCAIIQGSCPSSKDGWGKWRFRAQRYGTLRLCLCRCVGLRYTAGSSEDASYLGGGECNARFMVPGVNGITDLAVELGGRYEYGSTNVPVVVLTTTRQHSWRMG